ncbi:MAG TPA: hypothetical protein VFZ89_01480 [Solirubrobacteraceae bacterium]
MRHRLAILILALVLLAPAAAAAQDGNPFDGQLPPSQPTPAPTVEPVDDSSDDIGTTTLWIIGGAVAVALLLVGVWISRDARSNLSQEEREHLRGVHQRDEGQHKHERQAKAKARAKGRAQRQARKAHRKKAKR